jgi:hypothetical protein
VRYAWITRHKRQWPCTLQCEVLGVGASGYFAHVACGESKSASKPGKLRRRLSNEAVLAHIKAAHAGSKGEYGWPRIWKELISRGGARRKRPHPETHETRRYQGQGQAQVCGHH